jgi:hypothetical protein
MTKNIQHKILNVIRGSLATLATFGFYAITSAQTTPGVPSTALGEAAIANLALLAFASVCMVVGIVMLVKEKVSKSY